MPKPNKWRRRQGPRDPFSVPLNQRKGPKPGPEILPWFWHPDNTAGSAGQVAPEAFTKQLAAIDRDLRVVWSPVHERWLLWVKNTRITHELCKGWQLLMIWEHPVSHAFLPLNELLFHNLILIDARRFDKASGYYQKIQDGIEKAKADKDKTFTNDRQAFQKEYMDAQKISTAGAGNKAAMQDSIVPSRGELLWRQQRRKWNLPKEIREAEAKAKELASQ